MKRPRLGDRGGRAEEHFCFLAAFYRWLRARPRSMAPPAQSLRAWLLKYGDLLPAKYLAEKSQLSVPISPLDSSHGLDRFIRFLVFWCKSCWWKKVEGALLVRSEVLLLSVVLSVHLCGAQSVLIIVHRGLVPGVPAARCSSSRAGAVDVSFGSGSGSSISVNLPPCRPGRGRRTWFSGTESCVR
jgi:hypothetical protein